MSVFTNVLAAVRRLVGNKPAETALIFLFIVLLVWAFSTCQSRADEIDLETGASFAHGNGAVLGLEYLHPIGGLRDVNLYAGTLLWGATAAEANNWSWEGGLQGCKRHVCIALGAAYLQRTDSLNGSHTNFNLTVSWLIGWRRASRLDLTHLSNAGTTAVNQGRNAALVAWRLQ
jgi:hypothetical protein